MVLAVLRRRWRVIALCAALVPVSTFAYSISKEKQYTASASLLFRDAQFDQKLFGSTFLGPSADPYREAATNIQLVSLDVVAARAQRRLPEVGSVRDKVQVEAKGQSNIITVRATDPDPATAARIANTLATEYIRYRREADRAKIQEAQRLVNRQLQTVPPRELNGPRGNSLRERSEQLQVLSSLQTGNAELAQSASPPSSPSSPKVFRNTFLGGLLGLLLGVGLAFRLERHDRRIRDPEEMQTIFGRPILAAIPQSRALTESVRDNEQLIQEVEAFHMLRANLRYFNIDRDVKSVLVTSAAPGDGKTTVAWNLAAAASGGGARVLAIEADLRHPRFAGGAGRFRGTGLSSVLAGQVALEDALEEVVVSEHASQSDPRTIDVLFSGPLPPNPTDLLESERMQELLEQAERDYDFVVIDTPPTSVVSDAIPLVGRVGGVIVVGRLAETTREAFTHLRDQLQNLNAPTLGVVVNAVGTDARAYGYGYGYGYGARRARQTGSANGPARVAEAAKAPAPAAQAAKAPARPPAQPEEEVA